jgi:hypothetical protein
VWLVVTLPGHAVTEVPLVVEPVPVERDASNWKFVLIVPDDGFT